MEGHLEVEDGAFCTWPISWFSVFIWDLKKRATFGESLPSPRIPSILPDKMRTVLTDITVVHTEVISIFSPNQEKARSTSVLFLILIFNSFPKLLIFSRRNPFVPLEW